MNGGNGKQYWEFGSRLFVSLSLFGSVIAIASVSISTVTTIVNRQTLAEADRPYKAKLDSHDIFTPVEQQISEHEAVLDKLKSPVVIDEEKRNLASLYWKYGKKSESLNSFARSEQAYRRAITLDPTNAQYFADLAGLYSNTAQRQRDPSMRVSLYRNSWNYYQAASDRANRMDTARAYNDNASYTAISIAKELRARGDEDEAAKTLRDAAAAAVTPSVARQLNQMLGN